MIQLKKGREEIMYLLTKATEKYKAETGHEIIQNTNRKNYESLAQRLSEISNQLPLTEKDLSHDHYLPDNNQAGSTYPFRKYDITGGQLKDAISGIVSNPRPFLVDACYIYVYGIGRKGFAQNPTDDNLIADNEEQNTDSTTIKKPSNKTTRAFDRNLGHTVHKKIATLTRLAVFLFGVIVAVVGLYFYSSIKWQTEKNDLNILPYQPSRAEIDSLEGVWLTYTGSPQARMSLPNRYHKVVPNIVEIKYKNGYFTLVRYGASFNHTGFAQFEAHDLVSLFSKVKSSDGGNESPRHSLMNISDGKKYISAISASWNFDIGEKNKMIGIREVFIKQGKGGEIEEVMNQIENSSCQCKIIRWHQTDKQVKTFYLKNELIDSLTIPEIKPLINEKSILLKDPQDSAIILNKGL